MRKFIAMLLTVALLVTSYGACFADRVKLPASLLSIEKETFYGDTSVKEVVVPYGTQYIMARAFAYSGVEKIYIPDTVTFIAGNAFDGVDDVVICAPEGSYAAAFAEEYDYLLEDTGATYRTDVIPEIWNAYEELSNGDPLAFNQVDWDSLLFTTEEFSSHELPEEAVKYNQTLQEAKEARAACQEAITEIKSTTTSLVGIMDTFSLKATSNGVLFSTGDINYTVSGNNIESIDTNDIEIVSVTSPEDSESLVAEIRSNGRKYYINASISGFSITDGGNVSNMSANATLLTDLNLFEIGSFGHAVEIAISKFASFETLLPKYQIDVSKALEVVQKEVDDWVKAIDNTNWLHENVPDYMRGPTWDRDYERRLTAQKEALKAAKNNLNKLKKADRALGAIGGFFSFKGTKENLTKIKELWSVHKHGHPLEYEQSDSNLISMIQNMNDDIRTAILACACDIVNTLLNYTQLLSTVIAGVCTMTGVGAPVGLLEFLAVQAAVTTTRAIIVSFVGGMIFGTVAETKYLKVMATDKLLHSLISGHVKDADTKAPIKNVFVTCGGKRTTTNSEGFYTISAVTGDQNVTFTKKGYADVTKTVTVKQFSTALLDAEMTTKGAITGTVVDATTGEPISGVTVRFGDYQTTTNSSGRYIFEVKAGTAALSFSKEGYIPGGGTATCEAGKTKEYPFAMSKEMALGTYRVVLSWGISPKDLDSHLVKSGGFHVFFSSKTAENASLDHDDTTSYGPETITFTPDATGTYTYYVHDYTNKDNPSSKALSKSGAIVRVYCGSEQIGIYSVPSNVGLNWTVFTITNGVYKAAG